MLKDRVALVRMSVKKGLTAAEINPVAELLLRDDGCPFRGLSLISVCFCGLGILCLGRCYVVHSMVAAFNEHTV